MIHLVNKMDRIAISHFFTHIFVNIGWVVQGTRDLRGGMNQNEASSESIQVGFVFKMIHDARRS